MTEFVAGEPAPETVYRTADGRLAEAVVLDHPYEIFVEEGEVVEPAEAEKINDEFSKTPPVDESE